MRVIHYADVQVKTRTSGLYLPTKKVLTHIEQIIASCEADSVVLAGDLFEYPIPTESERKLIYNHLSNLLNIETLKEIVLLAGNHDLLKEKKETETTSGHNAINVFVDFLNHLDADLAKKIIYINESRIYNSLVSDNVKYYGYSLEDNEDVNFTDSFETHLKVCVYHGMLKEFVDEAKIPLRKDIYAGLRSIESFPQNSIILAGDIHKILNYSGLNGQEFYYSGSTMQHTHSEGMYINIGETVITDLAEKKIVRCYDIDEQTFQTRALFIDIPQEINYLTVTLDPTTDIELLKKNLSTLGDLLTTSIVNVIKIKSTGTLVKYEKDFYDVIQGIFEYSHRLKLSFEYDKLIQSSTVTNTTIKKILAEKEHDTNIDFDDLELSYENMDSLVLSNSDLEQLFASQINQLLTKNDLGDLKADELKNDIIALFNSELQIANEISSKRYNLKLKSIETHGFQGIGANNILLDIPGITRILGTNGIGKTTLYNMIRWVISGEVYANMSKNQVIQNNLLCFNKNDIDTDIVSVRLIFEANDKQFIATRTIIRVWKNNTLDENKLSLNWKDYVSTVNRDFKLQVDDKTYSGDQAEKAINTWFGGILDNILFMNQVKISQLLLTEPKELNQMVLNFVGVDYLNKLEANLDSVKTELMNVSKPSKTKEQIFEALTDTDIKIKSITDLIATTQITIESLSKEVISLATNKDLVNKKLVDIGNIELQCSTVKVSIDETQLLIDTFEEQKVKELPVFNKQKPTIDAAKALDLQLQIELLKSENLSLENALIENSKSQDLFNSELDAYIINGVDGLKTKIAEYDGLILSTKKIRSEIFVKLFDEYSLLQQKLNDKYLAKLEVISSINNEIKGYQFDIETNELSLISGVCKECKRAFDDDFENHKTLLTYRNEELSKQILQSKENLITESESLTKIKGFLDKYSNYCSLVKQENIDILINPPTTGDNLIKLSEINEQILELIENMSICNENIFAYNSLEKIKFGKYNDLKFNNEKVFEFVSKHQILVTENTIISEKIKSNNGKKDLLVEEASIINANYTKELNIYNTDLELFAEELKSVDEFNKSVEAHNRGKFDLISKLSELFKTKQTLETEKLPVYLKLVEELNFYDKQLVDETKKLTDYNLSKNSDEQALIRLENTKTTINAEYDQLIKYLKNNVIWKIYSGLIKKNFKELIFEYYRNFLNKSLNSLLADVNFKLFWNDNSELYHLSYHNGRTTYQPVQQSSGMETTFLGLALVYTIHNLNIKNTISHIFIDEISGTLNAGKELSYNAENYKELLVLILNKFRNKSVFVIDHSVDNLFETVTYEVIPDVSGSKYIKK